MFFAHDIGEYEVQQTKSSSKLQVPHLLKFLGELLHNAYRSMEKLAALILALAKKYGATIACMLKMCAWDNEDV